MVPARRVGPGQALWARGVDASTPAAFCSALLTNIRYVVPGDVPPATWQTALRHFAERQVPEATFHFLLEQRAARGRAAGPTPVNADPGARGCLRAARMGAVSTCPPVDSRPTRPSARRSGRSAELAIFWPLR
jgi:hypothetical protein